MSDESVPPATPDVPPVKKLSRQRLWQLRKKQQGKCTQCGADAKPHRLCPDCRSKEANKKSEYYYKNRADKLLYALEQRTKKAELKKIEDAKPLPKLDRTSDTREYKKFAYEAPPEPEVAPVTEEKIEPADPKLCS